MTKNITLGSVFFIFIAFSYSSFGENSAANLGYVDLQKALQTVEAGKSAKSQLEKEISTKKADLEKQQTAFQKEAEQFEKKAAILNESAKAAKQAELQKKLVELQKSAQQSQMELANKERELTKPILDELKTIVEGLGKERSLAMVVEKNEGAVLYAQSGSDLTEQVIERFNSRNKGKTKK